MLNYNFLKILPVLKISFFLFFAHLLYEGLNYNFSIDTVLFFILLYFLYYFTIIRFINNLISNKIVILDWFRISTFVFLIIDISFSSVVLINKNYIHTNSDVIISTKNVNLSLFVLLIGLFAIDIGYFFSKNIKFKISFLNNGFSYKFIPLFFYSLILSVLFAELYFIFNNKLGYGQIINNNSTWIDSLVFIIDMISPFLLSFLLFYFFKETKVKYKILPVIIILILIQIFLGLISGMKENVFIPFLQLLICYILFRKKIPKLIIYTFFVSSLFLYPINNNYRDILNNNEYVNKNVAFQFALYKTLLNPIGSIFIKSSDSYFNRFNSYSIYLYSVNNENKWFVYKYMNRYIYIPISWILPRFILNSKPKSNTGQILSFKYNRNTNNSISPTTFGWSYLEGGIIFVFFTFLLFSFIISVLEKSISYNNIFGFTFYTNLIIMFIKIESDIYFFLITVFMYLFVLFFISKIFFKINNENIIHN